MFANSNGIILELEKSSLGDALRYFNCSLLSSYASEDERLFIGGKQPLQFRSIRIVSNKHNYKHFVKALSLFDKIINAQMLVTETEKKRVSTTDKKVINALIKHEINEKKNKFPDYINECFKTFVKNKNIIKFNIHFMIEYYPSFIPLLMDKKHSHYFLNDLDNNLLDFNFISNVFKECEEIHSIRTDPRQNVFTGQGFMWLDSLIPILNRINNNKDIKLKRLRIFGKKDLNDTELYNNFKIYISDKTGWKLEKLDNQVVFERE